MEHKPITGADPLEPPSAEVARHYLDVADDVKERSDAQIDGFQGWLTIANGLLLFVYLMAFAFLWRTGRTDDVPILVFVMVASSQVLSGAEERGTARQLFSRGRLLRTILLVLAGLSVLAAFVVAVVGGDAAPFAAIVMPALVGTSAFVVIGVLQLRGAGRASIRETRARFERPARWTTFTLGLLIAVLILVAGFRDPLLSNLVSIFALFAVVVGIAGARTDWGLARLGQVWHWPQFAVLGASSVLLVVVVVLMSTTEAVTSAGVVLAAVAVVAFTALVSFAVDRGR